MTTVYLSRNFSRQAIRWASQLQNTRDLETSLVIFNEVNNRGVITLNRPDKANALSTEMVADIKRQIKNWRDRVEMIIIRGNDKLFSAGGDLVQFHGDLRKGYEFGKISYSLQHDISTLDIPYIAITPGAAFGNGVAISVHGSIQIATETTVLTTPETQLGFFPDGGMTYVFSNIPGGLGMYLALTSYPLRGVDAVKSGLASHFAKNSKLSQLTAALLDGTISARNIREDLLDYTENTNTETFSLERFRRDIDRIFTLPRLENMVAELDRSDTEWSRKTLETLHKMSPTCLKITVRLLQEAKGKTLMECLQRELQMNWVILHGSSSWDFREGIDAKLIRKDDSPKWRPGTIADVADELIDELFNVKLPSNVGHLLQ